MHGVNAVGSSLDNPPILRQCWHAARCLKDGQTIPVGLGPRTAVRNILDITTVFVSAASSPVLAPLPMQPVLHSSCSAPVPYVSGMTALEIDTCVRAGFPSGRIPSNRSTSETTVRPAFLGGRSSPSVTAVGTSTNSRPNCCASAIALVIRGALAPDRICRTAREDSPVRWASSLAVIF